MARVGRGADEVLRAGRANAVVAEEVGGSAGVAVVERGVATHAHEAGVVGAGVVVVAVFRRRRRAGASGRADSCRVAGV